METRRAGIELHYQSKKITEYIQDDLIDFTHVENASGVADDVSITLKDESGKWISSLAPQKGDIIKPAMFTTNWEQDGDTKKINCGVYLVDEIEYRGRPRTVSIKAISAPTNTNFMASDRSRTFKGATIKKIAQTIATDAGVTLYFESSVNPSLDYIEQSETTDSDFLLDLCGKYGLALKVYNQKLVIFNESEYESRKTVLDVAESDMLEWSVRNTMANTAYDGVKVSYNHKKRGKLIKYTYKPGSGNKIYALHETAHSLADAELLAKNKLRELNKNECKISFSMPGQMTLRATNTINIIGFGTFSGKYYIESVARSLGNSGLVANFECHKVV